MSWPALSDYQEAVQTPGVSFLDPELQHSTPDRDPLGLPRAMSGNFAVVFPVRNSRKAWAVRCFSTFHADQEARYRAISQHLQTHALPWMVDFQYLSQGVRTRGKWYPILKMEWVEGELLNRYVSRYLAQPEKLFHLTHQFVRLVADLEEHGIAHGDLQHANLIVANHQLHLIDYDGMYVPSLKGQGSHELGHVNYQHPRRSHEDFGLYVDNFSAWVIYLSLLALSIDPQLWMLADSGDEHLLFRQRDFEKPGESATLQALRSSTNNNLNGIADYLTLLLEGQVAHVPRLRSDSLHLAAAAATRAGARLPNWLEDEPSSIEKSPERTGVKAVRQAKAKPPHGSAPRVSPGRRVRAAGQKGHIQPGAAPLPDWLVDHPLAGHHSTLAQGERGQLPASRVILGLWLLTIPLLLGLALGGVLAPATAGGLLLLSLVTLQMALAGSYVTSQAFRRKLALRLRIKWLQRRRRRLRASLDRLAVRQDSLEDQRNTTLARALRKHQERFLQKELARYVLLLAPVPGVGLVLKARLYAAGFRTAADIGPQVRRIAGIGPARSSALLSWRQRCEAHAARHLPQSLPPDKAAAIHGRWDRKLYRVRQARSKATQAFNDNQKALSAAERDVQSYLTVTWRNYLGQMLSL